MDTGKMKDEDKTKEQLIGELGIMRKKIAELEAQEAERKRAWKVLRRAEKDWHNSFDSLEDVLVIIDKDYNLENMNKSGLALFGKRQEEVIGRKCYQVIYDRETPREDCPCPLSMRTKKVKSTEHYDERFGKYFSTKSSPVFDENGEIVKLVYLHHDITERKQAEEELMAALREKEVLIREVHHRVKNNLQVISSILDMSSLRIRDEQANHLILDARSKIHSMATIHSQLYTSESFEQIDVGSHIREMTAYLFQIYTEARNITPIVEFGTINLEIALAVPYAIVLNELVANALRHAFKGREKGMVKVSAEKLADGTILTRVKDDGIGISPEFDLAKVDTLGLKLVRNIVKQQLKGKIQIKRDKGTEFIIELNP
jgi:PAS domain S-box-containing protein